MDSPPQKRSCRSPGPLYDDDVVWARVPSHPWWPAIVTVSDDKSGQLEKGDPLHVRFLFLNSQGFVKYQNADVTPFDGTHDVSKSIDGIYAKGTSMRDFKAAFEEACAQDLSKRWGGQPSVLDKQSMKRPRPMGPPDAPAAQFDVGTRRIGTDGKEYVVAEEGTTGGKLKGGILIGAKPNYVWLQVAGPALKQARPLNAFRAKASLDADENAAQQAQLPPASSVACKQQVSATGGKQRASESSADSADIPAAVQHPATTVPVPLLTGQHSAQAAAPPPHPRAPALSPPTPERQVGAAEVPTAAEPHWVRTAAMMLKNDNIPPSAVQARVMYAVAKTGGKLFTSDLYRLYEEDRKIPYDRIFALEELLGDALL